MSICKVEGFYDSIKKYEKVADVIKRASLEVEYLNQVCGTTASLKRYFSMYRNYLKAKISAKHLLQDKPMLALLKENYYNEQINKEF